MAIKFIKARKKQKYFIAGVGLIIVITFIVLWLGYFKKEEVPPPVLVSSRYKEIKINFKVLENPLLKEFQPFGEFAPFVGEKGRENPFLPY